MMESDPPPYLTPVEREMLADAAAGRPVVRTPEQGIADMKERIVFLTHQANKIVTRISEGNDEVASLQRTLAKIKRDLDEATSRLAEYTLLQLNQN